ncbi:MAG: competence/damage-inducible protein A, partial [Spirochaetota bacterium]
MIRTALVATGNELVYGKIREYNNYYLSKTLFTTNCEVVSHYTVGDNLEMITRTLHDAMLSADLVIITGGLGQTDDDRTVEVLQNMLHFEISVYQPGLRRIEKLFNSMGRKVLPGDFKMVTVPSHADVFDNDIGLAVGFSVSVESAIIIVMPGVPREMEYMFTNKVYPYIESKLKLEKRDFLEFKTILMREAEVNNLVGSLLIPFENITWS